MRTEEYPLRLDYLFPSSWRSKNFRITKRKPNPVEDTIQVYTTNLNYHTVPPQLGRDRVLMYPVVIR